MIKSLLVLVLCLLFFQTAKAQQDTLVYYMKNSGKIVTNKDSADYYVAIMPPDTSTGQKLYPIHEFYPNAKRKLMGASKTQDIKALRFEGVCTSFFPNGRRKMIENYDNGSHTGSVTAYYPNGRVYTIKLYTRYYSTQLVECRDSTGKMFAEKGNGKWLKFDDGFKKIIAEGPVADSVEDGEWHGAIGDTGKYVCLYVKGKATSGTGYDRWGKAHSFINYQVEPHYAGDFGSFSQFLAHTIQYPVLEKFYNVQERIIISFVVERDGSITDVQAHNPHDAGLAGEAMRAVKLSTWAPGLQYGMPVRAYFTVPVTFTLTTY